MLPVRKQVNGSFSRPQHPDLAVSESCRSPWRHPRRCRPGSLPEPSTRSRRVPREPLDARNDLTEQGSCQVAFGKLQREVPGMSDQPPACLEQPLLEAREGPGLDGDGQNKPAEQIAEVVGDHPEQQADLIGPESVTGEPGPVSGFLAPP